MSQGPGGTSARDFFRDRFGLDDRSLAATLDATLERRVDYADLFFEYSTQDSVVAALYWGYSGKRMSRSAPASSSLRIPDRIDGLP